FTNQSILIAEGGTFNVAFAGENWTNSGTLKADGGNLNLMGNWSNTGEIIITDKPNSVLNLGGNFTTAGLGKYTRNGGVINLVGLLDNSGKDGTTSILALNAATGSWNLALGGMLRGGILSTADGAQLVAEFGDTLDALTVAGTVLVHS